MEGVLRRMAAARFAGKPCSYSFVSFTKSADDDVL